MYYCKYSEIEEYILDKEKLFSYIDNPKTFICYLFPYYAGNQESNISKYARGKDYHIVVKEKLEIEIDRLNKIYPNGIFCSFCDNSPLPEVRIAYLSGCGILGKNGLIFDEKYGGYVFIGIIATDVEIDFVKKDKKQCINCGLCVKTCPTGAILENFIDTEKCLSHITQTNRDLSVKEEQLIGKSKYIWGCDVCLDVCPMNKGVKKSEIEEFTQNLIFFLDVEPEITRKAFKEKFKDRAFTFRGPKPLIRNVNIKRQKNNKI